MKLCVARIPLADPRYQPTRIAFPLILPRRRILAVFVLADAGLGNWVAPSETNVAARRPCQRAKEERLNSEEGIYIIAPSVPQRGEASRKPPRQDRNFGGEAALFRHRFLFPPTPPPRSDAVADRLMNHRIQNRRAQIERGCGLVGLPELLSHLRSPTDLDSIECPVIIRRADCSHRGSRSSILVR